MIARCRRAAAALVLVLLAAGAPAAAQTPDVVHGADSIFVGPTVRLAWAVRRGASEAATDVVIRLVNIANAYGAVRLDGVEPFTKAHTVFVATQPLAQRIDLVVPRQAFAEHPSAEIKLFRSAEDAAADRPELTIFYLGVPDTTPEFTRAEDAEGYLARMLETGSATR